MSMWRQLKHGLRSLKHGAAVDREVDDEVRHYLDEATAELMGRGLSAHDARRKARLEFGNATAVRQQVREYGWENILGAAARDLRYTLRRLRLSPGFTTVCILTLALGIGASAAIFSMINGVLLKPLPYPHSDRLVALWHTAPGVNITDLEMAPSLYFTYGDESRTFEGVALWTSGTSTVTGLTEPEEAPELLVTNRFLPLLGIRPTLGRRFTEADENTGAPPTIMLTDGYWHARFGGNRSVVGRRLTIDGEQHEVIGVLPPGFEFMDRKASYLRMLRFDRAKIFLLSFNYRGIARLRPGATIEQANADIRRMLPIAAGRFRPNPGYKPTVFTDARIAPNLRFLKDDMIGDAGKTLWVLMGTMGMVLLIACANVANLLLVRADGRCQELAVRAALGASFARLARELLLESMLLSITGGAIGLAFAWIALRVFTGASVTNIPRLSNISVDPLVVLFTMAVSLAGGFAFGLVPVLRYARPRLSSAVNGGGRRVSQSRERHSARSILVVAQVTLATVLLIGSGLMIRTAKELRHVDPGFSGADQLQTLTIGIPGSEAKKGEDVLAMQQAILSRLSAIPGVVSAAVIDQLPMQNGANEPIWAEDRPDPPGTIPAVRRQKFISPGYVATLGSHLAAGRDLTWADTEMQSPVALVSENLARELWGEPRLAVGKRIRSTLKDDWREVIGVVADLRDDGVDRKATAVAYWPLALKNTGAPGVISVQRGVAYLMRTRRAGSAALMADMRAAVAGVNANLPVANVKTLQEVYERSLARTSFTLVLLSISGGMALLLGAIGIYGVISYAVSQRTREIGIRIALGARLREVTAMFVRHGLILSGVGAVCGIVAAVALTRVMKALLYGVTSTDPLTYLVVTAGLVAAAALASYLPARRVGRVDPLDALRAE